MMTKQQIAVIRRLICDEIQKNIKPLEHYEDKITWPGLSQKDKDYFIKQAKKFRNRIALLERTLLNFDKQNPLNK